MYCYLPCCIQPMVNQTSCVAKCVLFTSSSYSMSPCPQRRGIKVIKFRLRIRHKDPSRQRSYYYYPDSCSQPHLHKRAELWQGEQGWKRTSFMCFRANETSLNVYDDSVRCKSQGIKVPV